MTFVPTAEQGFRRQGFDDLRSVKASLGAKALIRTPQISRPSRLSLLGAVIAFRTAVAVWAFGVFVFEWWERASSNPIPGADPKEPLSHPWVGFGLVALMAAFSISATVVYRRNPNLLLSPTLVVAEVAIASSSLALDPFVYGVEHAQILPSIWPIAAIATVAIAAGTSAAVVSGAGLGLSLYAGWLIFRNEGAGPWSIGRVSGWVLLALAGWVFGYLLKQQERADRSISAFKAREEVARTLHDGVLQTLALIQRRSGDTGLVDLARTQELELRDYLFGSPAVETDLGATLRATARSAEQRYRCRIKTICAPDLPSTTPETIEAISKAVGEALTNASKHGQATQITIYAEPEEQNIFVSVKDNGCGFDPNDIKFGQGLKRSIVGRIEELGGRVEIDGRPGHGAEIGMWV